jgi:EAL domain-containing protein (putative c-di-GMP-specific phosphodiesterase class I)
MYAPTEILSERLGSVLVKNGVEFSRQNSTFALNDGADRTQVIELLRAQMSEPEAQDLRITSDLINLMAATNLNQFARRVETGWFEEALVNDRFVHWFQPIVDSRHGQLIGHECLIRLQRADEPGKWYSGDDIINAAVTRGDLHKFDAYSRGKAIRHAAKGHKSGWLFINFTPSSIYDPAFCMASTRLAMAETHLTPADIVFEVVESDRISNPGHLKHIVEYYRTQGFRVALDDVGTGANSLQMVADIQPDFIKLDKSIIWKYGTQIGLRTIRKLAELSSESGIAVIAEGVESAEMRDILLENGIDLMQGYFFGKPAPGFSEQAAGANP